MRISRSAAFLLSCVLATSMIGSVCPAAPIANSGTSGTSTSASMSPLAATTSGTLSVGILEPGGLDPYSAWGDGSQVAQALFDCLTCIDPLDAKRVLPAAAESWTVNSKATVWTFVLDPDGRFSDGSAVTAHDFVYAWNRVASTLTTNTISGEVEPSGASYQLELVKGYAALQSGDATGLAGLRALDDKTLRVSLSRAYADFAYVVASPVLAPVPKSAVDAGVMHEGARVPFGTMPIGNGPFRMTRPWVHGEAIELVRNSHYAGPAPYVDGIDFKVFDDEAGSYAAFGAGELDFSQVPADRLASAAASYGVSSNGYTANPAKQVLRGAENTVYYIVLNMKARHISKLKVRQAISYAIDRKTIGTKVFMGTRIPADGIVPPGVAGYKSAAWPAARFNRTQAKRLLAQAGYPGGKGLPLFTLYYNKGGGHEPVMARVKADLAKVGIRVTTKGVAFETLWGRFESGKFQMSRMGWGMDHRCMDNILYPLFATAGTSNYSKYAISGYAVLRKLRLLEAAGQADEALALARAEFAAVPSLPLALAVAERLAQRGDAASGVRVLGFSALLKTIPSGEWALLRAAANFCASHGAPANAVEMYRRLLAVPELPGELRLAWLREALVAAAAARDIELSLAWEKLLAKLTADEQP